MSATNTIPMLNNILTNPHNNIYHYQQNPLISTHSNSFVPYHGSTNMVSNSRWNPISNPNHIPSLYNIPQPILLSSRDRLEQSINTSKNKAIKLIRLNITYKSNNDANISIEVPYNFSLYQLHDIIQSLFSFNDYHLHQFQLTFNSETLTFSLPDPDTPNWRTDCNSDGYHWASHDHPHDLAGYHFTRQPDMTCNWMLDERVISIYDALCLNDEQKDCKVLEYEYDFGACHEILITAEEVRTIMNPKELRYPKIIEANQGLFSGEDRNFVYRFDMGLAQQNIDTKFYGQWPLELEQADRTAKHCYVCKHSVRCPNRTQCSGVCCVECIKTETVRDDIDLSEFYLEYVKIKRELKMQHIRKINGVECNYIEPDGESCDACFG